ncbi:MAG: tetratricopeptide repeat protein [Chloroflexi bacterium]|nr:tetratricopeptide repeat protein [Chloroflexota bacterium]
MESFFRWLVDNKDPLELLFKIVAALFGSGVVGTLIVAIYRGASWLYRQWRLRQFRGNTFPFDVIKPNGDVLRAILDAENVNDPLPASSVPYTTRVQGQDTQHDLESLLNDKQWVLILARTGLGKTREAAELARHLNQLGWTVLNLTRTELVTEPATFPRDNIGTDRKLLFVLDDLNRKMSRGKQERLTRPGDTAQQIQIALQERLQRTLVAYEKFCSGEIRVIATARDETERERPDEPSEWEKLEWDTYSAFWKRFALYRLESPQVAAQASILEITAKEAAIPLEAGDEDYIARHNDGTFRNLIENLKAAKITNTKLSRQNFIPTLQGTWEERYREAVTRYPAARYVYDAVDLLRTVGIDLYDFTVEPTARLIAGGNFIEQLWRRFQIHYALGHLINSQHILTPSDGQIEAKETRVMNPQQYLLPLTNLLVRLGDSRGGKIVESFLSFGVTLYETKQFQNAVQLMEHAARLNPGEFRVLNNFGVFLAELARYPDAEAAYRKAIELNPNYATAYNNLGLLLHEKLQRYPDAEAAYRKAIELNPNYATAYNNLGNLLDDMQRYPDAEAAYRKAIELNPNDAAAYGNLAYLLRTQERFAEAEPLYRRAIELDPENPNRYVGLVLLLRQTERAADALPLLEKWSSLAPNDFDPFLALAAVHKKLGHQDKMKKFAARARELSKPEDWYNLACLESICGNIDAAFENLRRAAQEKDFDREHAKRDPDLEWIRDDARFKEIVGE